MKIRKRITITFMTLFGVLITALCLIVYLLSASTQKAAFFERLSDRVQVTEEFFLESDVLSAEVKQKVRNKFLQTLPRELEFVSEVDSFQAKAPKTVRNKLPVEFVKSLKGVNNLQWSSRKSQVVANLYIKNGRKFIVLVIAEDTYGHQYLGKLKLILIGASLIAMISAYALSTYFAKQVLKPISEKINKANQISASQLDLRLTVYNEHDELGMLAKSFNKLLDRLQESIELEKNFVRYASHELKNPLAVILGESEVALMSVRTKNEYIETIAKIKDKAERLNNLVEHFLQLSRMEAAQLKKKAVNIDELIVEIIFELSQSKPDQVDLQFNVDNELESDDLEINADRLLISKALFNLIQNALKFSGEKGRVAVGLHASKKDGMIRITVDDSGQGIETQDLKHIYKPLYRGNNSTQFEGTGIGLALVKKIIDLHEGTIEVTSQPGRGTMFTIELHK